MYRENDLYQRLVKLAYELENVGDNKHAEELLVIARKTASLTIHGSLPPSSLMESIKLLLTDTNTNYAVIGGLAVCVWGNPRSTDDIDLLVDRIPPPEKTRDKEYMRRLGFYPAKSNTGTHLVIDHDKGMVELLLADTDVRQWALATAVNASVLGVNSKVVSPEGLVALKVQVAVSNPKRQAKDIPDAQSVLLTRKVDLDKVRGILSPAENALLDNILIR